MKKCIVCVLLLFLGGCSDAPEELEIGMELRSKLLQASECSFDAEVTADYGKQLHTFSMNCNADAKGNLRFTITDPQTISGISGSLSGEGGQLVFEDTALHFPLLAEQQLSPISAPWILMKTLRSGYLTSGSTENGCVRLSVDDSYEEDPLRLDILLDENRLPKQADILYQGRRILSVALTNLRIL